MSTTIVTFIVAACCRHAKLVVLLAVVLTGLCGVYAIRHFAIDTDASKLVSSELPWRKRQAALTAAFPQNENLILVVIDGATPEIAQDAADRLVARLRPDRDHFDFVELPHEQTFFSKYGLLFRPLDEVRRTLEDVTKAQPLIATLSFDPSLRGLMAMLGQIAIGIDHGETSFDRVKGLFGATTRSIEGALDRRVVPFSFAQLIGPDADLGGTRRFVRIKAKLDYRRLEPGMAATDAVLRAAAGLGIGPEHGTVLRMTGQIPLDDQEFGTVKEGFLLNSILTVLAVVVILWLALRSFRLVVAVFVSTFVGLVLTAAFGLAAVGALNLISVAFAVLFVGIGVDFGIQFSVRYRDERFARGDLVPAITAAGAKSGRPLMLAAAATAAGFFSFLPTDYKGVSELGLIAGGGMIVAFATSITLLPALLMLLCPPSERAEVGYACLAPLDAFLERRRLWVVGGVFGLALLGSPLLAQVRFDFNLLDLSSPTLESVATLRDLAKNPSTTPDRVEILTPSLSAGRDMAARLAALPEVGGVTTLASFVPPDQEPKLVLIRDAAELLGPSLVPEEIKPAPSDAEVVAAMTTAAERLERAMLKAADRGDPAVDTARRLAQAMRDLAAAPATARQAAVEAFVPAMNVLVRQLAMLIGAGPVALDSLPPDLQRDWLVPDGRARVEVTPKILDESNATLAAFARVVRSIAPEAAGQPIIVQDSGRSVIQAFVEAGCLALASIALLLYLVLRRIVDVLLTLVPLLLAGILTLELTVLIDLPLNFANIIALPLLLGLGVAFKIYFVMAWRAGQKRLLQSSLTRAVCFSALATAAAFGSLWCSNHPGTSSMGELLTLSLACTLVAAVFFQPALMGPPREKSRPAGS